MIELVKVCDSELACVIRHLWNPKCRRPNPLLFASNDSILEAVEFWIYGEEMRSVVMQLETHKKKNGTYLWMQSARRDRNPKAYAEYSREQPVRFVMKTTARGLIEMSHYRMCAKAESPTREFFERLRKAVSETGETGRMTAAQMMPMCAFRNGLCTEMKSCGNPKPYGAETDLENGNVKHE